MRFKGDEEYYPKELMSKEFWSLLLVLDIMKTMIKIIEKNGGNKESGIFV
jgi:hypothetical protein